VGEEKQGEREGKEGKNSGEGYGRGKGRHILRSFVERVAICTASFSRSWLAMAVLSHTSSTCVAHHDVGAWIECVQTYTQTHKQVDRQKADRKTDRQTYICVRPQACIMHT